MSCANPQYYDFIKDYLGRKVPVPCGVCMSCKRDKQRMLELRAKFEHKTHSSSAYVTLTYDDNHLRYNRGFIRPTLRRKDVHEFFDRLRHNLKNIPILPKNVDLDFSYMFAGEYGSERFRPHVHIILFGVDFAVCRRLLQKTWTYGSIDIKPVKNGCIRYVAKYLAKQLKGELSKMAYFDQGIEPEFVGWSKSFGSQFFYEKRADIARYGAIKDGNNFLPVPSYYKNKYFFYDADNIADLEYQKEKRKIEQRQFGVSLGYKKLVDFVNARRLDTELNLFSRAISRREEINLTDYNIFLRRKHKNYKSAYVDKILTLMECG